MNELSVAHTNMDEHAMIIDSVDPSHEAHNFLDKYGTSIHPALDTKDQDMSKSLMEAKSTTFSLSTQRQAEEFLEIMDAHHTASKDGKQNLVDLRAKTSWEDMLRAAKEAEIAYQTASRKPLRKAGRWVSEISESTLPFLRLIPTDGYGATLYGGLRLVFEATSRLDERRVKVLKSFLRIPNIILQAESCVQNYPSDELLFKRAEEVFLAALPAIEGTIRWLRQHPGIKQVRAILLGSRYNKSFKEKLQNLDEALNELQERASILRDASILKTEDAVSSVKHIVDRTDSQMSAVIKDLKSSTTMQEQTQSMVNNIHELEEIKKDARRAISLVLEEKIKTSEWMKVKDQDFRRLKAHVEALEKLGAALTRDDLLELMDVKAEDVREEFRRLQRACQSIEIDGCNIAMGILKSHRMEEWLSRGAATCLFIESRSSGSLDGRVTPSSFLSSEIIDKLRDREPAVAIYFFCGYHSSPNDPIHGPIGMMRSLISQVLRLYPIQLDFISRRVSHQLENLNLHTLCDSFVKLVKRLPRSMVLVCVIDGISFFEKKAWMSDCRYMLNELRELLNEYEAPIFKLLVTSPSRSRYVVNEFPEEYRLILTGQDLADSRHEPTEREMNLARSRRMQVRPPRSFAASMRGDGYRRGASTRYEKHPVHDSSSEDWMSELETETDAEKTDNFKASNGADGVSD